ncbi:uncharacterized protein LOC142557384 [Dermacentor variabilis]|uniref:uncharacterized protein LOC142557384 n=1 Tax=Dermacentor variabilis TaxID=34621 RepID=UPI003F5B1590
MASSPSSKSPWLGSIWASTFLLASFLATAMPYSVTETAYPTTTCSEKQFRCITAGNCVPGIRQCDGMSDCADGSDEQDCNANRTCLGEEFRCVHGGPCIRAAWRCDGQQDCADGSDERNCTDSPKCSENEFACRNDSGCISSTWRCDGRRDCSDGSDEDGAMCNERFTCPPDKFPCKSFGSFVCLPTQRRCDGDIDCDGAVDEKNCTRPKPSCSENEFTCVDLHQCIPAALGCDGKPDCEDRSDEDWVGCVSDTPCPSGQFACRRTYGGSVTCLPATSLCDGQTQCVDGSDEVGCEDRVCEAGEYSCVGGRCIPQQWTCNGKPDCRDGADEDATLCLLYKSMCRLVGQIPCDSPNGSVICIGDEQRCNGHVDCRYASDERRDCAKWASHCRGNFFRCDNGRCVLKHWRCDGDDDCFDGSDERDCDGVQERSQNCSIGDVSCFAGFGLLLTQLGV